MIENYKKKKSQLSKIDFCKNILAITENIFLSLKGKFYCFSAPEKDSKKRTHSSSYLQDQVEYKKVFSNLWLAFLQMPDLPEEIYQLILLKMNQTIIPYFDNPFLLNDFISQSFSKGGEIAVLSMDSLFTLITKYNL